MEPKNTQGRLPTMVREAAPERSHFSQVPHLIDDLGLSLIAHRLYLRLKRVAGDAGACWQSTETLAEACGISMASVVRAKRELAEQGLIEITEGPVRPGRRSHIITLVDIWQRNADYYNQTPPKDSQGNFEPDSPQNVSEEGSNLSVGKYELSVGEKKNIPSKNIDQDTQVTNAAAENPGAPAVACAPAPAEHTPTVQANGGEGAEPPGSGSNEEGAACTVLVQPFVPEWLSEVGEGPARRVMEGPPLDPLAQAMKELETASNKAAVLARLFTARYGDQYAPNYGRLNQIAKRMSGEHAALAKLIWSGPVPQGDPHNYLYRAAAATEYRKNAGGVAFLQAPAEAAGRGMVADLRESSW